MSFSRETCRITDGSIIMSNPLSLSPLSFPPRPLEVEPGEANIAETDIIDFALRLINDREAVAVDSREHASEIPGRRDRRTASARHGKNLRGHRRFGCAGRLTAS